MEIRDLRTFLTVGEAGGVTRGAERLHVVQSAASTAIKRLESELGGCCSSAAAPACGRRRPAIRSSVTPRWC